jgi:RsmE family RNA methyltransferase
LPVASFLYRYRVNLILFEPEELERPLPLDDVRARHVLDVLRRQPGDSFDAGLIDGPRGKATVVAMDAAGLHLRFDCTTEPLPLEPITLIVGLPRPQTARKVLEEATALGVEAIHFVTTGRGESGYASSRLWTTGEWRRHLIAGAQQAFTTRLPAVTWALSLSDALPRLAPGATCLALDNYEAPALLGATPVEPPVIIAIGPERGWTPGERTLLREAGFRFAHLGERVLRVETASVAAVAIVRARLGGI